MENLKNDALKELFINGVVTLEFHRENRPSNFKNYYDEEDILFDIDVWWGVYPITVSY